MPFSRRLFPESLVIDAIVPRTKESICVTQQPPSRCLEVRGSHPFLPRDSSPETPCS